MSDRTLPPEPEPEPNQPTGPTGPSQPTRPTGPTDQRPTTTSLGAFRDLQTGPPAARPGWRRAFDAHSAAGTAVVAAAATALLAIALVIAVSLRSVRYGAPAVVQVGLVLVVVGAVVAVVAGVVALVGQLRHGTGGQVRAVGSVVVVVAAVIALVSAVGSPPRAERGGAGQGVLREGVIGLVELAVGDCLTEVPPPSYDDPDAVVPGVPCTKDHAAEVVAVDAIPDDGTSHEDACEAAIERTGVGPVEHLRTTAPDPDLRATYEVGVLVCLST